MRKHVEKAVPGIATKSSDNCKLTVAVVGFDDDSAKEGIIETLIDHNYYLKAFFSTENVTDHIKYIDTKPLRKDAYSFQATFKVSKQLRILLKNHGDRLIVGIISCKLWDRVFAKRCAICQEHGHYFAECPDKDHPKCALCAGDHETKNCQSESAEFCCINCIRHGNEHTNHAASSFSCPVYLAEIEAATKALSLSLN